VTVTDVNGVTAFLQVIAVSSGKPVAATGAASNSTGKTAPTTKVLWVPAGIALILLLPAYWLGGRSKLVSLRNKMLHDRENYEKQQQ
jgi:hypothetical protein